VGYVAFDHAPDAGALIGMAVIIASGLCMAYVQRRQGPVEG
ncbi:MAG: EamA/RhaT family transporter, partial [Gammaproteobacteria bacterium HGW-Gammaproteobacteria-9]